MHTFTFKVINKNLTDSTLLVQYIPDDSSLSPQVSWVGVPAEVLEMSLEEAKEEIRRIIIQCSPQQSWETEERVRKCSLINSLDDYIGVDFPPVEEDELQGVEEEIPQEIEEGTEEEG